MSNTHRATGITTDEPETAETPQKPESIEVTCMGVTFSIPTDPLDWPASAVIAFEEDKALSTLRELAGPEAWRKIAAKRPTARDLTNAMQQMAELAGFVRLGE